MKEVNHHILKEALGRLPQYKAPAMILDSVFQKLNDLEADNRIVWKTKELPVYAPPSDLWMNIESELPAVVPEEKKIRRIGFKSGLAIAASLLVLVIAGRFVFNQNTDEVVSIAFSEEPNAMESISMDWNDDDEEIQKVVAAFTSSIIVQQSLDADDLLLELEELDTARQDAIEMLSKYGRDATVITQITHIENERSAVVKKMVELMFG